MRGLLVDFGGVLTTNVFDSFRAFCRDEGLDPETIKRLFREDPRALASVRGLERGELSEDDFAERFGELLELEPERRAGLVERMFGHIEPDEAMLDALRRARAQGVRTGLISNSMGAGPLRPLDLPGAVRRRRHLGRRGHAQARARDLRARLRARGPRPGRVRLRRRPDARTASAPRPSG